MAATPKILVLNGPNLNMLGTREPEIYGSQSLSDLERDCLSWGKGLGLDVECRQSNHEGELVGWVQEARGNAAGIVLNAGALTHTSVALLDALLSVDLPVMEVHLSNIYRREPFRHHSYVSRAALGVICGLGSAGYRFALEALASHLGVAPSKD